MAFKETPRFPDTIAVGAAGGPEYSTLVTLNDGGYEQRLARWTLPLRSYDVAHGIKSQADFETLLNFFLSVQGMKTGFRFKDWSDFEVATTESYMTKNSELVYQVGKNYVSGATTVSRDIKKVVDASYTIYRDGSPVAEGAGAGQYSIDVTTGIVTFVADATGSITAITKALPGVITSATHGLSNGDEVYLDSIGGMTALNGQTVTVTVVDPNNFSIGIDTTHPDYDPYTSGGTWSKNIQSSETLTWSGEFDVPVRFNTDKLNSIWKSYNVYEWGQIPLIELRL